MADRQHHFVGNCGLWHRHPLKARKTGDSAAPPRGTAGSRFSRFPTHLPLFLMNIHLAGAHGAYTSVRCRGASEPAHHPGRTWGVHQGTLLLCFCGHPGAHGAYYRVRCCCAPAVSGFKSQPKRGPPKKGKLGFCLWNGKHWVFLPRGAKLSARLREAEGFGL